MEAFRRKLIQAVSSGPTPRDEEDKQNLVDSMSYAVRQFLKNHVAALAMVTRHDSYALEVCRAVEDILLHGIRPAANLLNKLTGHLSHTETLYRSLWEVLSAVTHGDKISSMEDMPLSSYCNRCRAWVRLAMNEGLIDKYLEILIHEGDLLASHFGVGALIRDPGLEKPEIVCSVLKSVARFDFQLSIGDLCDRPIETISGDDKTTVSAGPNVTGTPASDWSDVAAVTAQADPATEDFSDSAIVDPSFGRLRKKKKKSHQRIRSISSTEPFAEKQKYDTTKITEVEDTSISSGSPSLPSQSGSEQTSLPRPQAPTTPTPVDRASEPPLFPSTPHCSIGGSELVLRPNSSPIVDPMAVPMSRMAPPAEGSMDWMILEATRTDRHSFTAPMPSEVKVTPRPAQRMLNLSYAATSGSTGTTDRPPKDTEPEHDDARTPTVPTAPVDLATSTDLPVSMEAPAPTPYGDLFSRYLQEPPRSPRLDRVIAATIAPSQRSLPAVSPLTNPEAQPPLDVDSSCTRSHGDEGSTPDGERIREVVVESRPVKLARATNRCEPELWSVASTAGSESSRPQREQESTGQEDVTPTDPNSRMQARDDLRLTDGWSEHHVDLVDGDTTDEVDGTCVRDMVAASEPVRDAHSALQEAWSVASNPSEAPPSAMDLNATAADDIVNDDSDTDEPSNVALCGKYLRTIVADSGLLQNNYRTESEGWSVLSNAGSDLPSLPREVYRPLTNASRSETPVRGPPSQLYPLTDFRVSGSTGGLVDGSWAAMVGNSRSLSPQSFLRRISSQTEDQAATAQLLANVLKLCPEQGLGSQGFSCPLCRRTIGVPLSSCRQCHFDGLYYCTVCHTDQEHVIPARVLHNWDFKPRPVCQRSFRFLTLILQERIFNVSAINPMLASHVTAFKAVQGLRQRLAGAMATENQCAQAMLASELGTTMSFTETDDLALLSLQDLMDIESGAAVQQLESLVERLDIHMSKDVPSAHTELAMEQPTQVVGASGSSSVFDDRNSPSSDSDEETY